MVRDPGRVDPTSFAARRAVRNLLGELMRQPSWSDAQFDGALAELSARRSLAVRQILLLHREGRIADEVLALELLGRLARPDDDGALAAIANDPRAPESARVACALVILGHDRPELISSSDITSLVLCWQARFVAEEPALRYPLARLYQAASREERAGWVALQDDELRDPEARAAMFEMLLEVERDAALRLFLIDSLARTAHPAARASLRRVTPQGHEERDLLTSALALLAAEADPTHVPAGWSARVGFCDGDGIFPLRFDFRRNGARPRSALFLLSLDAGVRDALALSGPEIERYDGVATGEADDGPLLFPIPVPAAWSMLLEAERTDLRDGRTPPRDHLPARRLLDPLADLSPRSALPIASSNPPPVELVARSELLLDAPGYADWRYDAGEHQLDPFRLALLERPRPEAPPDEPILRGALESLRRSGEPRRLARLLAHNAVAHAAAGEQQHADVALAVVAEIAQGRFAEIPLVRRMVSESLHPGLYFLAPPPDIPPRASLIGMLLGRRRPTKGRVFAVDLAWILLRAFEVWASRLPARERPHDDLVQDLAFTLAQGGARRVTRWLGSHSADSDPADPREAFRRLLRREYEATLRTSGPPFATDRSAATSLLDHLVKATESLVFDVCLGLCEGRCPAAPRRLAGREAEPRTFPAGPEAERFIRTWPGRFAVAPSREQETPLAALLDDPADPVSASDGPAALPFRCGVCGQRRQAPSRSSAALHPHAGGTTQPVCRRCLGQYRRDASFREQILSQRGSLS